MIDIQPVGQPHHRRDRAVIATFVLVLGAMLLAILKPWAGVQLADIALASAPPPSSPAASPLPSPLPPGVYSNYSTSLFGDRPHAPVYELWPAGYLTTYGFSRVLGWEPAPIPEAGFDTEHALDIGTVATTVALGINHPADLVVRGFRLWRLPLDGPPTRVFITILPSPFDTVTFDVIGMPSVQTPDRLIQWPAGLYRLDMLTGATALGVDDGIASLTLRVDPDPATAPTPPPTPVVSPVLEAPDPRDLRDALPDSLLVVGGGTITRRALTTGDPGQGECGLADTWLAQLGFETRCAPMPVGRAVGLAFDGGAGVVIAAASLSRIDPTAAVVGVEELGIAPGLALVMNDGGQALPEGTYRLDVTTADGQLRSWYFEVEPGGVASP